QHRRLCRGRRDHAAGRGEADLLGLDVRGEPRPAWRRAPGLRHLADRLQRPRSDHRQRAARSAEDGRAAAGRKASAAAEAGRAAPAGTAAAAAIPAAAAATGSSAAPAATAAGWAVWRIVRELAAIKSVVPDERSDIRGFPRRAVPGCRFAHPGYGLRAIIASACSPLMLAGNRMKSAGSPAIALSS